MDNMVSWITHNWERVIILGLALRAVSLGLYDAITLADEEKLTGFKRRLFIFKTLLTYLLGKRI
jgi:hypothetical protein